jgi:hypothetical protein
LRPDPTGHDRHVVDREPFDHRVDGGFDAFGFEFARQMFFPELSRACCSGDNSDPIAFPPSVETVASAEVPGAFSGSPAKAKLAPKVEAIIAPAFFSTSRRLTLFCGIPMPPQQRPNTQLL